MRRVSFATGFVLILASVLHAAPLSIGDAQAAYGSGDYRGCLQKISSLLTTSTIKPASVERYDLLMLRGECMLKLKQAKGAADTFEAASKVLKTQGDVARVANAKAMSVLVKASPGLQYRSNGSTGDAAGIDIVEPDSRKQAMKMLLDDRNRQLMPAINKAIEGTSLVPIQKLLPAVWEIYTLEFAAKGNADQTTATVKKMGQHARDLITSELDRLTSRLTELNNLANEPTISSNRVGPQTLSYRGLNSNERNELKEMMDYLLNIQQVCENARRINRLLGGTGEAWDALLADCAEARQVADQAYNRQY